MIRQRKLVLEAQNNKVNNNKTDKKQQPNKIRGKQIHANFSSTERVTKFRTSVLNNNKY